VPRSGTPGAEIPDDWPVSHRAVARVCCPARVQGNPEPYPNPIRLVSSIRLAGTAFLGNTASRGGAIYQRGGSLAVNNSQYVSNTAGTTGGCIYTLSTMVDVYNTTFKKNTASEPACLRLPPPPPSS